MTAHPSKVGCPIVWSRKKLYFVWLQRIALEQIGSGYKE